MIACLLEVGFEAGPHNVKLETLKIVPTASMHSSDFKTKVPRVDCLFYVT